MTILEGLKGGVKPDPLITITEWSDRFRILSRESAKEFGLYRSDRTPYVKEIMDELSPQSPTKEVIFMKPTQIGATEIGNNLLFCVADIFPAPCLFALPTGDMARRHSKKRIAPAIKAMPCLKNKIKESRSRDSGNTLLIKEFPGGSWIFTGSNSPVAARSEAIKILVIDDYDGFEPDIGGEGEPGDLFCKRTDTYSDSKKIYKNSTPTIKHFSNIEREYEESSKGFYEVPCPYCGLYIRLLWGYLKFDKKKLDDKTIYIECPKCFMHIKEYQKTSMLAAGQWVHEDSGNKKKGYKLNGLYAPLGWVPWLQIIDEFLKAQGKVEKLRVWNNTRMAEPFEEGGDQPEWIELKARAEAYEMFEIPDGGMMITAGADVHANRIDLIIRAWGRGEENWLLFWGQLYGDPTKEAIWKEMDGFIERDYKHASGALLSLISLSVDSGYATQEVYNYVRQREPIVVAVKGAKGKGSPILSGISKQDIDYEGTRIKGGVDLWNVGTGVAKMTIYRRLKLIEPGIGYYHYYIGLLDEYYEQLTAERLLTRYVDGFPVQKWVNVRPGGDNHALDCEVYCYHAALRAGVAYADWDGIEQAIKTGMSKSKTMTTHEEHVSMLSKRDKKGWIDKKNWIGKKGWLKK